jgi:adenine-specific DNA-methyltransferase
VPDLLAYAEVGHTQDAKKQLMEHVAFEQTDNVLDTVKPTALIRRMLQLATQPTDADIVLDFFAGSGPTGHAVFEQNREDGGNRRFILVQLPLCKPGVSGIADILRARHASSNHVDAQPPQLALTPPLPHAGEGRKPGRGFRVFKLAESSFKPWNAEASKDAEGLAKQLELHVDHIRDSRTADDILYEILLKSGFPLTTPVEPLTFPPHPGPLSRGEREKIVYSVAGGVLFICLERELTLELMRAMAEKKPERVVCLDEGFAGNDQLKANAVQIFKTKGVTSFKTV